jgi:imidazolonepropionase-like amidohydrolase
MTTTITLFKNVLIFDGTGSDLSKPSWVLVEDNKILKIAFHEAEEPDTPQGATIIDGQGIKVLMPGLTDAHYHLNFAAIDLPYCLDPTHPLGELRDYVYAKSVDTAGQLIQMGFTAVRDTGGNTYQLKRDIDQGHVVGPRIYPSGTILTQTSGHFDFRNPCCWMHEFITTGDATKGPFALPDFPKLPGSQLGRTELLGETRVVDGVPEMLRATRENLMRGSTQIKIATGGGVSSMYDPIDVAEFTAEEIKACTDAAGDWNTYVCTHCFTSRSIQRSIENGIRCIEHGFLMDEKAAQLIKDTDTWLSLQPLLDDEEALFPEGKCDPVQRNKFVETAKGVVNTYRLAKEYGLKTAFGTDTLFNAKLVPKEGKMLSKLTSLGFTPAETLKMATSENVKLFKMCGPRDPYGGADFGLVQEGCFADLILLNGNPLENIQVIVNRDNVQVVMKDGKIYKNIL